MPVRTVGYSLAVIICAIGAIVLSWFGVYFLGVNTIDVLNAFRGAPDLLERLSEGTERQPNLQRDATILFVFTFGAASLGTYLGLRGARWFEKQNTPSNSNLADRATRSRTNV